MSSQPTQVDSSVAWHCKRFYVMALLAAAEGGGDRPIKESDASLAGLAVLMRYDWLTLGLAGLVVKECVEGDFVKNKS